MALTSARLLAGLVDQDGRFIYHYHAGTRERIPGYNNVRHAGCIWALNIALREARREPGIEKAAFRAMQRLVSHAFVPSRQKGIAVLDQGKLKLGASALAALALLSSPVLSREDVRLAVQLCAHIWQQKRPDGDFHHVRLLHGDDVTSFRSEYYTGEALFALLLAGERLGDEKWFARGRAALESVLATGYGISQQSHWMMYAVETAYRMRPDPGLLHYADRLVDDILQKPSYRDRRACTPVACRSEALLAYLRMAPILPDRAPRRGRALRAVEDNLALQLRDRLPDGSFRCGHGHNQVRIDYIQHNMVSLYWHARPLQDRLDGKSSRSSHVRM